MIVDVRSFETASTQFAKQVMHTERTFEATSGMVRNTTRMAVVGQPLTRHLSAIPHRNSSRFARYLTPANHLDFCGNG